MCGKITINLKQLH